MDCREMEQYLSPYLDNELTREEVQLVQDHLMDCAVCQLEYDELIMLVSAVNQMGNICIPAPAGFKNAVMKQILEESRPVSILEHAAKLVGRWRPAVTATAAALLIAMAGIGIHFMPASQVANNNTAKHNTVVIADKGQSTSDKTVNNNTTDNPAVSPSDSQGTVNNTNSALAPLTENRVLNNNTNSSPVFLNTEQVIKTTLLRVRVTDSNAALEQAIKIAAGFGASFQNLGQQVNENGTCSVLQITVAQSSSANLITNLGSLGTVTSQEVNKKDVTSQFAQTLSKYQTLTAEREKVQDAVQKAQLDGQITKLEGDLNSLQTSAEKETVVLWLEK
ncbi:MAG: DUF4349 domain-containing protein [Syntrophomonas sp.]